MREKRGEKDNSISKVETEVYTSQNKNEYMKKNNKRQKECYKRRNSYSRKECSKGDTD